MFAIEYDGEYLNGQNDDGKPITTDEACHLQHEWLFSTQREAQGIADGFFGIKNPPGVKIVVVIRNFQLDLLVSCGNLKSYNFVGDTLVLRFPGVYGSRSLTISGKIDIL